MKGPIPDPANPSPLVLAIREKIAKAKADGQRLLDEQEYSEIEKQMG